MSDLEPKYSPLCDTDSEAYKRYIDAYKYRQVVRLVEYDGLGSLCGIHRGRPGVFDGDQQRLCSADWRLADDVESADSRRDCVETLVSEAGDVLQVCVGGVSGGLSADTLPASVGGDSGRFCRHGGGSGDVPFGGNERLANTVEPSKDVSVAGGDVGLEEKRGRPVAGSNILNNKKKRAAKKARKERRKAAGCGWRGTNMLRQGVRTPLQEEAVESLARVRVAENAKRLKELSGTSSDLEGDLRDSLRKKWKAQNELAAAEAVRKLQLLNMVDISDEVKRKSTALRANIERNMVAIEKTHATLVATGNVPEVFHGSATTEVDSDPGLSVGVKSGTISPNSSISEAEVRAMQKQILDMELTLTRYRQVTGISPKALDVAEKRVWTDNSENHAILEELYPMGYGVDTFGFPEGKFRPT